MAIKSAATALLSGLARKGISEVKDEKVRGYLSEVWGDLEQQLPEFVSMLVEPAEVVLSGKHLELSKDILLKMKEDILAFKAGEIDQFELEDLVWRRKEALFTLYQAEKKRSSARPSIQKILGAVEKLAEILVVRGIPFLLALL